MSYKNVLLKADTATKTTPEEKVRANVIDTIEHLFPPDRGLDVDLDMMMKAIALEWRSLPTPVLVRLAELNTAEEHRQANQ